MLKIKKIQPLFNALITTMDKYENDTTINGIIDTTKAQGSVKEYQKVVAVGSTANKDIKVGDLVCINPIRFSVKKHKEGSLKDGVITDNPVMYYNFDTVEMNDETYLLLQDRDISFVISDSEEVEDPKPTTLIMTEKPSLIV